MQRVAAVGGAMEILHATGWEHAPHGHLLLNTLEPRLIEAATAALQKVQASHPGYLLYRSYGPDTTCEREQSGTSTVGCCGTQGGPPGRMILAQ